ENYGGLLAFDSGDAAGLASALGRALHDPSAGEFSRRALEFCERNYLFGNTIQPFLNFIESPSRDANLVALGTGGSAIDGHAYPPSSSGLRAGLDWVRSYLNVTARESEWAELQKYRSGRLARLINFLTG